MRQTSYIETNYQRKDETNVHCRNNGLTCIVPKKNIFKNCERNGKKSGMTNVRQTGQTTKERKENETNVFQ